VELRDLGNQILDRRLGILRDLATAAVAARQQLERPVIHVHNVVPESAPNITVQVVVPPEAFKITVNTPPAKVTVNVPEQPAPNITVEAPKVTLTPTIEPKIEVKMPERPTKAKIRHSEGGVSTIELT